MSPDDTTRFKQLTKLREGIIDAYNLEDVRFLVFGLGENYDDLRGETISAKIQALLERLEKRRRIPDLLSHLQQQRPNEDWNIYFPAEPEAKSPYKGLQYFTESDAHLFFGRDQLTALLVERLRKERFLVVIGASGSGKSSLVRAGLAPAIRKGAIESNGRKSRDWPIHIITPTDQPIKTLAVSMTRDSESVTAATTLASDLQKDSHSLDLFLMRKLADQPDGRLLLVVDQFEELFTQCEDRQVRQQFLDNLVNAVQSGSEGRLKLVLTMRADFYAFAVQYESLRPLLKTGQEIIGEMSEAELRLAILKPAEEADWQFQAGLVETILRDVGQEPGALPLLSHALQETWRRREGREMTLAGYQAAGGVRGAIAKTADALYANLSSDQQAVARTIFLRLTELGEGTEDTRRRVWQKELVRQPEEEETVSALLQQLANARLITTDTLRQQDGKVREVVEVSHEALIREWPALRAWLDENREWLRYHRRLSRDAREWLEAGRDKNLLYRGGRLAQADEQVATHEAELNEAEREFIKAGVQEEAHAVAEREAQRQRELAAAQELVAEQVKRSEAEAQAARRARNFNYALIVILLMVVVGAIGFVTLQNIQNEREEVSQEATRASVEARETAVAAEFLALELELESTSVALDAATVQALATFEVAINQTIVAERTDVENRQDATAQAATAEAQYATVLALVQATKLAQEAVETTPETAVPNQPTATPDPAQLALDAHLNSFIREEDNMPMLFITGGTFQMGIPNGVDNPLHMATVDSFFLDWFEVSVQQFADFLNKQGGNNRACNGHDCATTAIYTSLTNLLINLGVFEARPGTGRFPATWITWEGANAYCESVGGRLPTEAEWEYAARGTDGRIYPWGDDAPVLYETATFNFNPAQSLANFFPHAFVRTFGLPNGSSPFGIMGMSGGAAEWVQDWYAPDFYDHNLLDHSPNGDDSSGLRVLRGGSWVNTSGEVTAVLRFALSPYNPNTLDLENSHIGAGFRCARDN